MITTSQERKGLVNEVNQRSPTHVDPARRDEVFFRIRRVELNGRESGRTFATTGEIKGLEGTCWFPAIIR